MNYQKYMLIENASIPSEISQILSSPGKISKTKFEDKNEILLKKDLQEELGYRKMEDGNYLVSCHIELPGMTAEMVNWWFWWHPRKKERYMLWYPGEHIDITYPKKEKEYFEQKTMPTFKPNMVYPIERIGGMKLPLSIDFVTPEQFGYSRELMNRANVVTAICGHVGIFKDLFPHTEMSHLFFQKENGLVMVSRFWIGKRAKNPLMRKLLLRDEIAKGMAEHCYVEYHNFAKKIPMIYKEYLKEIEN